MHRFIHTLETIPKNWYLEMEVHRDTTEWGYISQRFKETFTFQHKSPSIYTTLQEIKHKIFNEEEHMEVRSICNEEEHTEVISICNAHNVSMTVHKLLECYNVTQEDQDDEDPRMFKYRKQKEREW
jgi:hypothetical protein